MSVATTSEAQVWVGCLACYNEGRLVGEWIDAVDAAEFVPCDRPGHDEFWVFDTEGMPSGECSPIEAARVGEIIEGWGDRPADVLLGLVDSGITDLDDAADYFDDHYAGVYDSDEDMAQEYTEDGLLGEIPDGIAPYIDYERVARDLMFDMSVVVADDGTRHYFHA